MNTISSHPEVDDFLNTLPPIYSKWQSTLIALRKTILRSGAPLTEVIRWKQPCYQYQGQNLLILAVTKKGANLTFLAGAHLADPKGILEKPGEYSQLVRLIRIPDEQTVNALAKTIVAYIHEAIKLADQKTALAVSGKSTKSSKSIPLVPVPEVPELSELREAWKKNPLLEKSFKALTPGRQRAYKIFFAGAKSSDARRARIAKYTERILKGQGMNDCVCGLSKKMPGCDGSHKILKVT